MGSTKMHADEVHTDASLVRRLLTAQFPQWADLPIEPVASAGTVNAIYRLGDDMVVRLPRVHELQQQLGALTRGEGVLESAFDRYHAVDGTVPTRPRTDHNPLDRKEYLLHVVRRV